MGGNKITDVGNPTSAQDAVTKYYIEQLGIPKFVVTSGIIPSTTYTDITIYTLPSGKAVSNGKITIAGVWVKRESGKWFDSNFGEFNYQWSQFYLLTREPTIIVYNAGAPASGWTCNYRIFTETDVNFLLSFYLDMLKQNIQSQSYNRS